MARRRLGRPQGEVARPQHAGAVEAQHVAGHDAGHQEGQAHAVAGGDEVRAAVEVHGDVVGGLGAEEREELLDGGGEGAGEGQRGRRGGRGAGGVGLGGGAGDGGAGGVARFGGLFRKGGCLCVDGCRGLLGARGGKW